MRRIEESSVCCHLLDRQSGVIGRQQALRLGLRPDVIDGLLRTGTGQPGHSGGYAFSSGPPGRDAWLWALVLRAGPGATLSHQTAAALHGLTAHSAGPIHLMIPRERQPRPIPAVILHRADRAAPAR